MYNSNNKRLRQSPGQQTNSSKQHKGIINTNMHTVSVPNSTREDKNPCELPILGEREQLMVNAFTSSMCHELDIRFSSFSQQEIAPLRSDINEMKSEIMSLNTEIAALKKDKDELIEKYDAKIGYLEREARETNLIFHNIPATNDVKRSLEDIYARGY